MKLTHGRHCPCTACASEDWPRITGPCGMHGRACPPVYDPWLSERHRNQGRGWWHRLLIVFFRAGWRKGW